MTGENVELVRSIYAMLNQAYASRELRREDFTAFYDSDVVLRTSGILREDSEHRGYDAVRDFTVDHAQAFETMSVEPHEYIDAGDQVLVPLRYGGDARDTGINTAQYVVHVWTIRDAKVSELVIYRKRDGAVEAVGLSR